MAASEKDKDFRHVYKIREHTVQFLDTRNILNIEEGKCVYFGSKTLLQGLVDFKVKCGFKAGNTYPVDFILLQGHSLKAVGHYISKLFEMNKSMFIIFDMGYEFVEHLTTTAIVDFADQISDFAKVYGHKMIFASMTIVPSQQGLQDEVLKINQAYNELNLKNGFTPHYGVRSVMKYHKASKSYKIRPSLWKEWNNNVGFGQSLDLKGIEIYTNYQKGYFEKGFGGTDKINNIV